METTFLMIKPDGVQRRLVGKLIDRLEAKGLRIAGLKLMRVNAAQAREHYREHEGKGFYPSLMSFIQSAPVVALVVSGDRSVAVCRKLLGATFGFNAEPGTIRGDFGISNQFNLIHGSDSPESAAREIGIYFKPHEILDYEMVDQAWLKSE